MAQTRNEFTVRLENVSWWEYWQCFFCGYATNECGIQAHVYFGPDTTSYIVCDDCLGLDVADRRDVIRMQAAEMRWRAKALDALALNPPVLPSSDELMTARQKDMEPRIVPFPAKDVFGLVNAPVEE